MPQLLSPTADSGEIVNFISDLAVNEALPAREDEDAKLSRNLEIFRGEHWVTTAPAGLHQFVINRTQRAIRASAAVQTEQRPRVRLSGVESNEPSPVYLSPSGVAKLADFAEMEGADYELTPGQMQGMEPFDDAVMSELMSLTIATPAPAETTTTEEPGEDAEGNPGTQITEETSQPAMQAVPVFGPEDFIIVNDKLAAEAMQAVYDAMWDRTNSDYLWFDNILYKSVYGWQPMLIDWDADRHLYRLHNVHHKNILIDPTSQGIEDADYVIFAEPMSADEAKARYPEHAEIIDREKSDGQMTNDATSDARWQLASVFRSTDFERDMVTIIHAWLRHQPFALTPEEAAERGVQPAMMDQLDEMGNPIGEQPVIAEDGQPVYTNDDGSLTDPTQTNWPTRPGIRQFCIIGREVVKDIECPFADIPFAWNVNIPMPHSPFGQGEPERLWDLQDFVNRLASSLYNHLKYYPHPQEYLPSSVKAMNANSAPHAHPGKRTWVPDDVYQQYLANKGGRGFAVDPPTVPAAYVDLLGLGLKLLDEESDNSDVLQGNVPSGVESGRAIDMLQTAARGSIGFKSLYTERAIAQAVRLQVGMIKDFLPESEWVKYLSGTPVQVLLAIRSRAKSIDYDIRVEVVSGKGANRRMNQQMAVEQFTMGLRGPISTMKALEIENPQDEIADILSNPISPLARQTTSAQPSGSAGEKATRSDAA